MPKLVRLTSGTLIGRVEELQAALAALRDLPEGRPGVVVVRGPAGIGKTRFVTTLADRLRADGVRVMVGACLDLGVGAPPYSALVGAFRSVDPPAVQVLDALTGVVDMRRSRLFELLRSTTAALARRRLTVLVVEDVHWSDRITRDALLYLTTMAREGRWALVVTFRDDEVAARPAVREFLEVLDHDALVYVTLDALSPREMAAQIAGIADAPPSPEYAERVHRRSGGIPLLVEEVLAAEAAGAAGVPDHLRDLFLTRVGRLGVQAARAVDVVAVVGDRCGERLVASVLGLDRARVAAALDQAVAADVLIADGRGYRMRHELLREVVYDAVPPARRRQLHRRIAATLASAPHPDAASLAHHWYQADEPAQAVLANLDAAILAERVHAPGEVHIYLQRVLEHFDALPADRAAAVGGRAALLARAAEAAYLSGAFERAVALAEECLEAVDEPSEGAVRWERPARYRWVSRDGAGAQQAYQRSVAVLLDDAPARVRARVLSGYAWYLAVAIQTGDARGWSERALEAADASSDPLERCRALLAWGSARAEEARGLAALWAARDLAVACDAGDELARAHAALDLALRRQGRTADREQVLRDGLGYVAAHGLGKTYAPMMTYLLAELLLDVGRWDEADEILEEVAARGSAVCLPSSRTPTGPDSRPCVAVGPRRQHAPTAWRRCQRGCRSSRSRVRSPCARAPSRACGPARSKRRWCTPSRPASSQATRCGRWRLGRSTRAPLPTWLSAPARTASRSRPCRRAPKVMRAACSPCVTRGSARAVPPCWRSCREGTAGATRGRGVMPWLPGTTRATPTMPRTAAGDWRTRCWRQERADRRPHVNSTRRSGPRRGCKLGLSWRRSSAWRLPRGSVSTANVRARSADSPGRWRSLRSSA